MVDQQPELLQGTLDLLILKALALTPLHGLGIARRIEQVTRGTFCVKAGRFSRAAPYGGGRLALSYWGNRRTIAAQSTTSLRRLAGAA